MSTSISLATPRESLYQKLILGLLMKMPLGRMLMTLPDGSELSIGNGAGVSCSMVIKNPLFFKRCVLYGDIGFGESYVDGDWDTDNITNVIKWFLLNVDHAPSVSGSKVNSILLNILKTVNKLYHSKRANSLGGSRKNISEHYDLNNDFFALFLDPTMTYSSAYYADEQMTLEQAQLAKYDRLCKQLKLQPNDHVLEIGSGWGGNAIYMAKNYGCKVTTLTISEEQYKLARERIEKENLTDKITVQISSSTTHWKLIIVKWKYERYH